MIVLRIPVILFPTFFFATMCQAETISFSTALPTATSSAQVVTHDLATNANFSTQSCGPNCGVSLNDARGFGLAEAYTSPSPLNPSYRDPMVLVQAIGTPTTSISVQARLSYSIEVSIPSLVGQTTLVAVDLTASGVVQVHDGAWEIENLIIGAAGPTPTYYSIVDNPSYGYNTRLPSNQVLQLYANTLYGVSLYASADAGGYGDDGLPQSATVEIDPAFAIDPSAAALYSDAEILQSPGVVQLASAVPEPSTWALMATGFVGIGFLGYRRRNTGWRQFSNLAFATRKPSSAALGLFDSSLERQYFDAIIDAV